MDDTASMDDTLLAAESTATSMVADGRDVVSYLLNGLLICLERIEDVVVNNADALIRLS